ncbi:MAG: efflux RND transporter permease subunit, partial [Pseudomonadota bacterium]
QLPEDSEQPVVAKLEFGADPIMWLVLMGDRTIQQMNQYVRNIIKKRLETIDGVGEVIIGGERERTIRVNLDLERMTAFQITTQDLFRAFQTEHVQLPGGYLNEGKTEELIRLDLEFHNVKELESMLVAYRDSAPIRLGDIAEIEDGLSDFRELAQLNGVPGVGIGVVKVNNANTVKIVKEVRERINNEIIPELPPGMQLHIISDKASYIEEIISGLEEHLVLGTLLAALVVWLFLRNITATLIVATAIPVSLFGAVFALYTLGYTFNMMTMLGLLLLIGVVVDDAIVVLENIFRTQETTDPNPETAAITGANQVVFAVIAASLTLVCIFAPVMFMEGIVALYIAPFAVVVTVGVLASLLVSITLTPMLCSRFIRVSREHGWLYNKFEQGFQGMEDLYRRILDWSLKFRWIVLVSTVVVVWLTGQVIGQLGGEFSPTEDESHYLVLLKTPLGSSIEYMQERLAKVEAIIAEQDEVVGYFSTVGRGRGGQVTTANMIVGLKPVRQRERHQSEVVADIREKLKNIPGLQIFVSEPSASSGGGRGEPLQFGLNGPNLYRVAELGEELRAKLANSPAFDTVDMDLQLNLPQIRLELDRVRAADLGLSTEDVTLAVNVLAGGFDVAKYNDDPGDGERYDIRLKAAEGQIKQTSDLSRIYLRGREGQMIRLDTIAHLEEGLGPITISRLNLQYTALFYINPAVSLSEGVEVIEETAESMLPSGYNINLVGQAEEFQKTVTYMIFAFATGILMVYMVLASQFNSFIQPLVIMVAQPLAIVGGIMGLWLAGHTMNLYSMIGLLLLIGLVAKNSILLIDLTNQLREQGQDVKTALRNACPIRMRPVLMTSLTVILALLPAAVGVGAGAEINAPMAVAVISGLTSSTLLTLVVVPVVYSLVEGGIIRLRKRRERKEATMQEVPVAGGGG